ncbi:ABC transporter G family member 23 [Benincasa hispida]|uniref:ABC transporter G family member 23 n=1 Tax=Benincasa hispida TaxID=102211 RepID=UPI001901FE56|nr:ABC transporter G family member 23 [Benincasa hispida]
MAVCLGKRCIADDTTTLFSTSNSPEETTSISSSSSHHHSPPLTTTRKLSVRNLSFSVLPKRSIPTSFSELIRRPKPINVLKSVSFVARSCQVLAIVGPSGTGKSSLLRILSGRVKEKEFDPKAISINDQWVKSPEQLRKLCGFVTQEDNLLPLLTVRETLMFMAKLRLRELASEEKEERVERLMQELGLFHVGDSFVGDEEKRGISGGERKRVSIGVEMIHDPPILLLDEPTSGLDSTSALQVVELISSMTRSKQRTVILSIHQPGYRILQYISNFLILSRGLTVHFGSLKSLEKRIAERGIQIPIQLNALEFAMEIIDKLKEDSSPPTSQIEEEENQLFSTPIWPEEPIERVQQHNNSSKQISIFSLSHFLEIMLLCSRFWKLLYRTKQLFLGRTLQAIVGGIGLGSVYLRVKRDEEGVTERLGLFAFSLSFLLSSTVESLPIFLQERRVLMKEASRGVYKISSYLIANTIIFLPFLLAVAILFAAPVYWIVGLNPSIQAFAFFTFVVWLIVMMASSLVLFLSAISPDFITGNSLICTVLGGFFLFSGYFIPKQNIPKFWMFMYYISLYRYPLDAMLVNEYWSAKSECFSWIDQGRRRFCALTGADVLKNRGLEGDLRWMNVGIMIAFFVLYRLLCWIVLARRASTTSI